MIKLLGTGLALAAVAAVAAGCESSGEPAGEDLAVLSFAVVQAPTNARCAVLTVTPPAPGTPVQRQFAVVAEQT
jgi:hypothetical protein